MFSSNFDSFGVSVVMPIYNGQDTVWDALLSVVNQEIDFPLELIVIDDGSTDCSCSIISDFVLSHPFFDIKTINNIYQKGAAGARNSGIDKSKYRFLAFLDSDDQWYPDKLKRQIEFMCSKRIPLSYTDYTVRTHSSDYTRYAPKKIQYSDLFRSCPIGMSTVIIDRLFCPNIKFDYSPKEDYTLWLNIHLNNIIYSYNSNFIGTIYSYGTGVSKNKIQEFFKMKNLLKKHNFFPPFIRIFILGNFICSGILRFFLNNCQNVLR
jgi:hypothetical protein